jgi:hypothetical protein
MDNREQLLSVLTLPQRARSINRYTNGVIRSVRYFRAVIWYLQ